MEKKDNTFGGFDIVSDYIYGKNTFDKVEDDIVTPLDFSEGTENVDFLEDDDEIEQNLSTSDSTSKVLDKKKIKESEDTEESTEEDEEEVDSADSTEEVKPKKIDKTETNSPTLETTPIEKEDLKEAEPEITAYIQERIYEKLGWEFGEDEKKLQSIDEVVDYLQELVEENSKPDYASDEIEELNKFVLNGGTIKNYFDTKYAGDLDLESVDLESPISQKRLIREVLKEQGQDSDKIEKRIKRYEETGVLEEEGNDAYEFLQKTKAKKAEKLLVEQENLRKQAEKQQLSFYNDVASNIKSINDVKGIEVTTAEKNRLIDYIFKIESDGKTKYLKEFQSSPINLIESAYLQMTQKSLVNKLQKKATSNASIALKKKLQSAKAGNRMRGTIEETELTSKKGDTSGFNVVQSFLRTSQN